MLQPITNFSKHVESEGGRLQRCKACVSEYHREYVASSPERQQKNRDRVKRNYAQKQALLWELKSVPCMDCSGEFHPCAMDFDHRPGETKAFQIARYTSKPVAVLLAEVAKCDVVCANCHRVRTWERQQASDAIQEDTEEA